MMTLREGFMAWSRQFWNVEILRLHIASAFLIRACYCRSAFLCLRHYDFVLYQECLRKNSKYFSFYAMVSHVKPQRFLDTYLIFLPQIKFNCWIKPWISLSNHRKSHFYQSYKKPVLYTGCSKPKQRKLTMRWVFRWLL